MSRELIAVFARTPEYGKVKTRIAHKVGNEEALRIYQLLLNYTHQLLLQLTIEKNIFLTSLPSSGFWEKIPQFLQKGNDLGERITNACNEIFSDTPTHCVIIGTDCAELTKEIIEEAFNHLNNHDMVIGPAKDRGYYLIGINNFYPDLFKDIAWGTATVFESTMEAAKKLSLRVHSLPTLNDVDEIEDVPASWLNPS